MRRNFYQIIFIVTIIFLLSSCNKKTNAENKESLFNNDSIPEIVKKLTQSIIDNDTTSFISLINYPLQRPYPLKDIASEAEMKAYYGVLMDDSIRSVIINAKASDWAEFGWRGWSLDNGGYIWIDDNIYSVPYVSAREQMLIDSLTNIEIESLPKSLQNGWKPILTFSDINSGTIYRIDMRTEGKEKGGHHYRMAAYGKDEDLHKIPTILLDGVMEIEGSGNFVNYIFHDNEGEEYIIQPDSPETGKPGLTFPNDSTVSLTKTYWHEIMRGA